MDIKETLRMDIVCPRRCLLSIYQKSDFLLYVFEGSARKFFLDNGKKNMLFADKTQIMFSEYACDARQIQIMRTFEAVRLHSLMKKNDILDVKEGLTRIVDHVNEL